VPLKSLILKVLKIICIYILFLKVLVVQNLKILDVENNFYFIFKIKDFNAAKKKNPFR